MPDLQHFLRSRDLGFLSIIARAWGIELVAADKSSTIPILLECMSNPELLLEIVEALPARSREALETLVSSGGKLSWALFVREYGEVRAIGPRRRDRERPDMSPETAVEFLWYRGLIGKSFFDLPPEPQEYAYLPDEFLTTLAPMAQESASLPGRPATPAECAVTRPHDDRILDQACTLLAAVRIGMPLSSLEASDWLMPPTMLNILLQSAGIIDRRGVPQPAAVRAFLESDRSAALLKLAQTWIHDPGFNDLRLLPELVYEGEWMNDPLLARQAVLDWIQRTPADTWWNIPSLVAAIHKSQPDFQRPAGDYDSWFIRVEGTEEYLRGFAHWDEVDGALIRRMISGSLAALGMVELARGEGSPEWQAFRLAPWCLPLLNNLPPQGLAAEHTALKVLPEGEVIAPPLTPRVIRYQVARFCEWEAGKHGEFHYRITPASLQRAVNQGLKASQLLALLRQASGNDQVPPTLVKAIDRWGKFGSQAVVQPALILSVASPEILVELRKGRAARFIGEQLNPTSAVVNPAGLRDIRRALAELGFLGEFNPSSNPVFPTLTQSLKV